MRYDLIYCDPPWWYGSRISRGKGTRTRFGNGAPYPLMRDQELLDMAPLVKGITAKRAMMFMWVTKPRLDFGVDLLRAWGFKYTTTPFVWIKTTHEARRAYEQLSLKGLRTPWEEFLEVFSRKGLGSYTNDSTEFVICGRKGKILDRNFNLPDGTIFEPITEHSRKPEIVRQRLEEWIVAERRLEMFCRFPAPGWEVTGNGVVDEDIRDSLRRLAAL